MPSAALGPVIPSSVLLPFSAVAHSLGEAGSRLEYFIQEKSGLAVRQPCEAACSMPSLGPILCLRP